MLELKGVVAGYGLVSILKNVSISVGPGEVVGVVGPNGAGKTTLIRVISGLLRPGAGAVLKDGVDITAMPPHRRAQEGIGTVLEGRHLFGGLSVRENLTLAEARGKRRRAATQAQFTLAEVFELFPSLREKMRATTGLLSGGQQQMLAIARALLLQPDVLLMDEPSTGLAPRLVEETMSVLQRLRQRGIRMILVEQNVAVARHVCDRAYVLELGRIVKSGDWDVLTKDDVLLHAYLGKSNGEAT